MSLIGGSKKTTNTSNNDNSVSYYTDSSTLDRSVNNTNTMVDNSVIDGDNNTRFGDVAGGVTLTDFGAINSALDFSHGVLDNASQIVGKSFDVNKSAISGSLNFGEKALETNASFGKQALDFAGDVNKNSMALARESNQNILSGLNSTVGKIADVVKSANTSDSAATIKYIVLGVVGVALAVFIAPTLGKK